MSKGARWPGDWLAICDSCGLRFPSSKLKKRWDGLMVCSDDWEPRHPQELLRVRPEHVTPPWVRPEPPDDFIHVCNVWESSPYADLAVADCAHADVGTPDLSFAFLVNVYNDHFYPLLFDPFGNPDVDEEDEVVVPPTGDAALKFNYNTNSQYLALTSVGGM
jgi:hypothetical protein